MKTIKIPFTNKTIIDTDKLENLTHKLSKAENLADKLSALYDDVVDNKAEYNIEQFRQSFMVVCNNKDIRFVVKTFCYDKPEDEEYAFLCAEELCEMLNQKI